MLKLNPGCLLKSVPAVFTDIAVSALAPPIMLGGPPADPRPLPMPTMPAPVTVVAATPTPTAEEAPPPPAVRPVAPGAPTTTWGPKSIKEGKGYLRRAWWLVLSLLAALILKFIN
jgi:hypothetical protein